MSAQDWVSSDAQHPNASQRQEASTLTELTPVIGLTDSHSTPETELALMEQLMVDVPHLVSSETHPADGANLFYRTPNYLPIDLRAKLVVCLIHGGQLKAAEVNGLWLQLYDVSMSICPPALVCGPSAVWCLHLLFCLYLCLFVCFLLCSLCNMIRTCFALHSQNGCLPDHLIVCLFICNATGLSVYL